MNKDLEKLFKEDQADRISVGVDGDFATLKKQDAKRKNIVKQLLSEGGITTGKDLYIAAMIFHHGQSVSDYKTAIKFAEQSIEKGYKKAKWLYAATTDRMLMYTGEKQKYGTQYKKLRGGKWKLWPVDRKTTDEQRAKFNVNKIADAKKLVDELNT